MRHASSRGFTLVEVLVALMVVAIGLAALMTAVSGTARTSGYLRDKTLAQWIALNRIAEVRLTTNRIADTKDTGQLDFANRTWHYDTRYFDTTITSMKRIVVRVWAGNANTKGNPIAEASGFVGSSIAPPGSSNNIDWTVGTTAAPKGANTPCTPTPATPCPAGTAGGTTNPTTPPTPPVPAPGMPGGPSVSSTAPL